MNLDGLWIQARAKKIRLQRGDPLLLVPELDAVDPLAVPARIGCTLPSAASGLGRDTPRSPVGVSA